MLPSTLPKRTITYVCHGQNKSVIKYPQTDLAKNKSRYDGIKRKQLELQTTEKELYTREQKLQEKVRKFNQRAKKTQVIQRETERKIKDAKKEPERLEDTAVKTDEKIKFRGPRTLFLLLPFGNQRRNSEYGDKHVSANRQLRGSAKTTTQPVYSQHKKENTGVVFDQLQRSGIGPSSEIVTSKWYSAMSPGDNYQAWRDRYKSKRMPLKDHVTVQQILLYSSVAVVCSPCLLVLILSSCFWYPFVD